MNAKNESSAGEFNEPFLVEECKKGSLASFEPIVKHHQSRLLKVSYQLLRDERLAEEAVQITFVKAWQKINKFNGECDFGTWLFRLCVNTSYDQLRSRNRKREDPLTETPTEDGPFTPADSLKSSEPTPVQATLSMETKELIFEALNKLPDEQRIVLILREMHGLDYREIARTLNIRQGTVMSRLFHARQRMRQLLKKIV